jgi:lysophospholipase L1-like esterase
MAFGIYLAAVTLVSLEVAVRIWGYSEHHISDPIYMSFARSPEIPYVHKPNLAHARAHGLAIVNTDSLGLRSETTGLVYGPKPASEYRIAIAGDSITFGEGVPKTEDTFAAVLEKTINQQQSRLDVRVLNYGHSAYSVKQMAATLRYRMFDVQPDLAIMAIIAADFDLTRTPELDDNGNLVDSKLVRVNPVSATLRNATRNLRLPYVLRDIAYPLIVASPDLVESLARGEVPKSYEYVRDFAATARRRGVPHLIVGLPSRRAGLFDGVSAQLQRDGIEFLDLSDLITEFTLDEFRTSRFDRHPSAAVHRRIGRDLADYIRTKFLRRESHDEEFR